MADEIMNHYMREYRTVDIPQLVRQCAARVWCQALRHWGQGDELVAVALINAEWERLME